MGVRLDGVREEALLGLYQSLTRHDLSLEDRETLEAALDFVLNTHRQAVSPAFLRRNVTRNARFSLSRSAISARRAAAKRPMADAIHRRLISRTADGAAQIDLISNETPESVALVSETLRELRAFANSLGAHGMACLRGLLIGATTAETAEAAGISIPTVERTWRKLRLETRNLLSIRS